MALTIPKYKQFQESKHDIAIDVIDTTPTPSHLLITKDVPVKVNHHPEFTFAKALDFSGPVRANIYKDEIGGTDVLTEKQRPPRASRLPDETAVFEVGSKRPNFNKHQRLEDPMQMFGMKKLASADNTYETTAIKNAPKSIQEAADMARNRDAATNIHREFAQNVVKNRKPRQPPSSGSGGGSGGGGGGGPPPPPSSGTGPVLQLNYEPESQLEYDPKSSSSHQETTAETQAKERRLQTRSKSKVPVNPAVPPKPIGLRRQQNLAAKRILVDAEKRELEGKDLQDAVIRAGRVQTGLPEHPEAKGDETEDSSDGDDSEEEELPLYKRTNGMFIGKIHFDAQTEDGNLKSKNEYTNYLLTQLDVDGSVPNIQKIGDKIKELYTALYDVTTDSNLQTKAKILTFLYEQRKPQTPQSHKKGKK
jgi:hypothetical protein